MPRRMNDSAEEIAEKLRVVDDTGAAGAVQLISLCYNVVVSVMSR